MAVAVAACVLTGCGGGSSTTTTATAVASLGALPLPASGWPEASSDARRDSRTAAVGPQSATVKWKRDLGASLIAGPVIAKDGAVIEVPSNGVVHALDPATGADEWSTDIGQRGGVDPSSSPAVLGSGVILIPGAAGDLVALGSTGKVLWRRHIGSGQVLSPAEAGGGRVYSLDPMTGAGSVLAGPADPASAKGSTGVGVWTAPVVDSAGDIYFGTASGHLEGITRTGAKLFDLDTGATVDSYPAIAPDGTLYAGSNSGTLYALKG